MVTLKLLISNKLYVSGILLKKSYYWSRTKFPYEYSFPESFYSHAQETRLDILQLKVCQPLQDASDSGDLLHRLHSEVNHIASFCQKKT